MVLTVRELRKVYPGKPPFVAVGGVSFSLAQGEILGLLGPNGAGKTTTIQMLLGTLTYTSGEIFYFGKEFRRHRSDILKKVVFASTYASLPWKLTVAQNLEVFGLLYGVPLSTTRQRMDPLLDQFGILEKKHIQVGTLSAGQMTRLVLVKAFIVEPTIVLLDEPTASLDPDVARDVIRYLLEQREKKGISILFTSHKMDEVSELCDRALFLRDGKIFADDLPENLARSVSRCKLQLIIADGMKRTEAIASRLSLPYKIDHRWIEIELDEAQIASVLNGLARADVTYTGIQIVQPTLEDYFLKMVQR